MVEILNPSCEFTAFEAALEEMEGLVSGKTKVSGQDTI